MNQRPSLTPEELGRILKTCRIVDMDMADGIQSASRASSTPIALAVLVASLRTKVAANHQPADADSVDSAVAAMLADMGLVVDEFGRTPR